LAGILAIADVAAATDGPLGATSSGSSALSVTTTEYAQITNIADVTVNPYTPAAGIDTFDNVCIYTNDDDQEYTITASGSGTASAFTIVNGSSDTIAYTVFWNNTTGSGATALTTTVASGIQTGATNTYPCVTNNASFRVVMTNSAIMSVPADTYTGTLTLLITPDGT